MSFAAALRHAMTTRKTTITQLAARTSLNPQTISNLRRGIGQPQVATAATLAEALHWDDLAQIAHRNRSRQCNLCRRTYVSQHTDPERRRFCSHKCQQVAWNRNATLGRERRRGRYEKKTTMLLREHQQAIEAFCRACEPVDFICRDAECPLRGVSPLPLERRKIA